LAHDGEADRAIESCQGILNAGRAFEGDPILIAHLIRIAMQSIHVHSVERVFAQSEPSEAALRVLQSQLALEIKESSILPAMRGERAGFHHLFANLENGKAQLRGLGNWRPDTNISRIDKALAEAYPRSLLKFYPEYLTHMNRTVEVARLPHHERMPKLTQLEEECKTTSNILISCLGRALTKVCRADARGQALLRSAMAAAACERYRQSHQGKQWPASLDVLVKARSLEAVPIDPFDGQPLRFRRTEDGVVIYSIGPDLKDDGGITVDEKQGGPPPDFGIRLWNLDQRRLPPRPPVVIIKKD
jgi:hypothetical protein